MRILSDILRKEQKKQEGQELAVKEREAMKPRRRVKETGQVALIVLAVMAIALTIGLSLSQRVLTDVQISEKEEESSKAFSAAEAGIEEALRRLRAGEDLAGIGDLADQLGVDSLTVQQANLVGGQTFNYPRTINSGEIVIVWLTGHNFDGTLNEDANERYQGDTLTLCWDDAALEAIYFYRDISGQEMIRHYAYDPDAAANGNGFTVPGDGATCPDHTYGATIPPGEFPSVPNNFPRFIALKPLYSATQVGVVASPGQALPSQGFDIVSTGEVSIGEEEKVSRKIKVFKGWNILPSSFFSAISAGGSITGGGP